MATQKSTGQLLAESLIKANQALETLRRSGVKPDVIRNVEGYVREATSLSFQAGKASAPVEDDEQDVSVPG